MEDLGELLWMVFAIAVYGVIIAVGLGVATSSLMIGWLLGL